MRLDFNKKLTLLYYDNATVLLYNTTNKLQKQGAPPLSPVSSNPGTDTLCFMETFVIPRIQQLHLGSNKIDTVKLFACAILDHLPLLPVLLPQHRQYQDGLHCYLY